MHNQTKVFYGHVRRIEALESIMLLTYQWWKKHTKRTCFRLSIGHTGITKPVVKYETKGLRDRGRSRETLRLMLIRETEVVALDCIHDVKRITWIQGKVGQDCNTCVTWIMYDV